MGRGQATRDFASEDRLDEPRCTRRLREAFVSGCSDHLVEYHRNHRTRRPISADSPGRPRIGYQRFVRHRSVGLDVHHRTQVM